MKRTAIIARGLTINGVRSFIESLLDSANKNKDQSLLVFTDEKDYRQRFPHLQVIYIKASNLLFWDYLQLPYYLYKHKVSEVVYTKNIFPFTHLLFSWRKIIYVLDLAFKYPELKAYNFLDSFYMNLFLGFSLKYSQQVWAISEFTKQEILKFYPFIGKEKIVVRHLPINPIFKKQSNAQVIDDLINKYHLQLPLIFYCGSISPRKNVLNLLVAFNQIKKQIPHHLYLLSSRTWNSQAVSNYLADQQSASKIHLIKGISNQELATFYSIADLFVYPSVYEGFGLPIKEAEACGCKVLTSNFGAMKEVASPESILTDTRDPKIMAKAILKELQKSKL